MEIGGWAGTAYAFCRWFVRLAYLNVLWVFFSFAGLLVLGIVPATVALFTITRKWVMGETEIPVAATFWKTYKTEFIKANKLGFILGVSGCIFYYNLTFLHSMNGGMIGQVLYVGMFSLLLMYGIILLYIFPVFVHYDAKIWQTIMNAFVIGVSHPFYTIIMFISAVLIYILLFLLDLFIFFHVSTIGLLVMWCAYQAFLKIDAYPAQSESNNKSEVVSLK